MRTISSLIGEVSEALRDYSLRCPIYILAQRSKNIDDLAAYIAAYYRYSGVPLSEQVDLIFVLKNGLIINNKFRERSPTHIKSEGGQWKSHFAVFENGDMTFPLFLLRLVSEIPPELAISKPVLWRYLDKMELPKLLCAIPHGTAIN
jgi:hypothetical protein